MTEKQAAKLRKLIARRAKAEVEASWIGAGHPGDGPETLAKLRYAKRALADYITALVEGRPA